MKVDFKSIAIAACVIGAAVIAAVGEDGWGWFLVVAVLLQ